jgi:peptide deformylase
MSVKQLGTPFSPAALEGLGAKIEGPQEVRTELVPFPHPALSMPCLPVPDDAWENGVVQELVDSLVQVREQLAAMHVDSYGIAAPQVAIPFRAFVWDNNGAAMALINPEIVEASLAREAGPEECLSFLGRYHQLANRFDAGLSVQVFRSVRCVVRALTVDKELVEVEAEGIIARMFQHEVDHLDGITMLDRLASRQMKRDALRRWYKMHPELKA